MPAVLYRFGLNSVLAFCWAYVLTRPLGASFADWMALPHSRGGLGAGTGVVTLAMSGVIVVLVAFLASSRRDAESVVAESSRT